MFFVTAVYIRIINKSILNLNIRYKVNSLGIETYKSNFNFIFSVIQSIVIKTIDTLPMSFEADS